MNIKRIFGALLTVLGIVGLIYTAVLFVNAHGGTNNIKALIIYGILGFIFLLPVLTLYAQQKMSRNKFLNK